MTKYLDPKSDVIFKKIFGEHKHLLKSFLNGVLPLPENGLIVNLEYLSPEQAPEIPILKRPVVDVRCIDQNGRIFIVEMQIEWTVGFMQRMLFNTSHAFVRQLKKGEQYNLLQPVYGLALLGTNFRDSDNWYHHYKMVNIADSEQRIEGLELVFIELKKIQPTLYQHKKLMVLWLRFLEINEDTRKVDSELLELPEIKEAVDLLEWAAYSEAELAYYDKFWDSVSCEKMIWNEKYLEGMKKGEFEGLKKGEAKGLKRGLKKGEAEGLKKGIQRGKKVGIMEGKKVGIMEAKYEIAKRLKMLGLAANDIVQSTGLSISEIEAIK